MGSVEKCLSCRKIVNDNHKSINCDECNKWLHFKCSRLTNKEFQAHTKNQSLPFTCIFCSDYICCACDKHVYHNQNSICCDSCDGWTHLKCTKLTLKDYNELGNNQDKFWFCRKCNTTIFPFSNLDDNKFKTCIGIENTIEKQLTESLKKNVKLYTKKCSVCKRKINKPNKGIPCKCCNSLIHRKCSGIKNSELNSCSKINIIKNWECLSCMMDKFAFTGMEDEDILLANFNSNFHCPCENREIPQQVKNSAYKFNLSKYKDNDKSFDIMPDALNNIDDTFDLLPSFKYYQTHDFHKLLNKVNQNKIFSLLHTNISSLTANFENLEILLENLNHKFDIIALTETWNPEEKSKIFKAGHIADYQDYTGTTGKTIKSGCGFYVSDKIKYISRKDLDISYCDDNNEYQFKWIEISNKGKINTIVGVCYRHPKRCSDENFNNTLKELLEKIKKENKVIIITGDFNYNLIEHELNKHTDEFINSMISNFFQPCILEPTRVIANNKPSLLDNIFINSIEKRITSGNIIDKISDHMPNFIILEDFFDNKASNQKIRVRDMKKFDKSKFLEDLQKLEIMKPLNECESADSSYELFHNEFMKIIDKHAPYKTLSKKEIKMRKKPWLTYGIHKSIKAKNRLYGKYLKTKDNFWYKRYKYHRDTLKNLIYKNKKRYFKNYFEKCLNNSKQTWKGINKLLHNNQNKKSDEIFLNIKGEIITDQKRVADKFNDFYINIAQKLVDGLGETNSKIQDYLKNPSKNSFFIKEIEPHEVSKLIAKLDETKSSDIYGISPKLIKIASPHIANYLTIIFNKSINEGKFPEKLKIALVIPIHKADSKLIPSNYRPISILPVLSKIFEQLMHSRLMDYLEKFKCLYNYQFGFQKERSTEQAIAGICSKIINAIEQKQRSCCIFLDFAKAFDTVNHEILLNKLEYYGIRGLPLSWFKSYLSQRKQCVQLGQSKSELQTIKCGVPQGSVLGPLLFLLYINDIAASSKILDFHLFADDTSIFYSHKDIKTLEMTLNNELKNVSDWLIANKLSLNVKKSNVILFKSQMHKQQDKINIYINHELLEGKKFTKYLGLLIDNKLTWENHIEHVNFKLSKGIGILAKLRHFVSEDILRKLYNAFIQPHVDYGLLLWGNAFDTHLHKIATKLNKAIRIISFKDQHEAAQPLFKRHKILDLNNNIKYNHSKFMWKYVHNQHPKCILTLFETNPNPKANQYITRQMSQGNLYIPFRRTKIGQHFITYSGVKLWNENIPIKIKENVHLPAFLKEYKSHLLSTY